ncbi:MAG: histidinol-phosphatase HisJ family protein [Clostridia bacterium]|nr:histidinol-phosphatase HisJ family protein [Clostridia bacterium]
MISSNFHTHSVHCDGKDTPADMAARADSLGFFALGFSGHREAAFSNCTMTPESEGRYRREIEALKKQYAGKMEIYCGVEQDYYAGRRDGYYDYAIGSVHWIEKDGQYLCVDWSAERTRENIDRHYHGSAAAYAADFYALEAQVKVATGCDVIGHFDLITKFDDAQAIFSMEDPAYRAAVMQAVDALASPGTVFEINTGAMAKGYRTAPYPAVGILKELHRRKCAVMINSDCHDKSKLTFGFDAAVEAARAAGFTTHVVLKHGRWEELPL